MIQKFDPPYIYIYYIFFFSPFLHHEFERFPSKNSRLNVMESLISNQSSLNCSLESKRGNLKRRFALKGRGTCSFHAAYAYIKVKGTLVGYKIR